MYIILDTELTEEVKQKYTLLPLEQVDVAGKMVRAFCLVPAEKLPLGQLANLDNMTFMHGEFIKAFEAKDYKLVRDLSEHLMGKFGGEVDSFYTNILERSTQSE